MYDIVLLLFMATCATIVSGNEVSSYYINHLPPFVN